MGAYQKKNIDQILIHENVPCYVHRAADGSLVFTTGIPLSAIDDKTYGIILSDFVIDDMVYDISVFMIRFVLAIAVTTTIFGLILNRQLNRGLVKPINEIADAARSYGNEGVPGMEGESHFSSLDIHSAEEVEILGDVMKQMEHNLGAYVKNLTEMTAREGRARTDLDAASQIQKATLPDVLRAIPKRRCRTLKT